MIFEVYRVELFGQHLVRNLSSVQAFGNTVYESETGEKKDDDVDPWTEGKHRASAPVGDLTSCACKNGDDDTVSSSLLKRTRSTVSSVSQ